ncbi:NAD(P)H-quinone oxidoreductase [Pelagibacterium sp. 26DY04]|uniref:NAD(P)H-quinone oxidoreductase n=1 Tax=Pelagibacterium sp. 26DY04 TaxID=2967130 RepID=UPI0028167CBF|nr:NAD(P)H-quinone oxidoreductase [Pelagibacterium sp. 26DY04]WMT86783.1 NAD(P)H-quinone oxidoreductase [Pelagibacterium sp. 26DY04]
MRAIEIDGKGGPEVLRLAERPVPRPGPGEVQIRVAAAGVNGADLAQRRGVYPPPEGASDLPGLEVAGTISAIGEGVEGFSQGDRVCALLVGGGYAEFCTAPAAQVLHLPQNVDTIEGAGLIETVATVWANVFEAGRMRAGEKLLVHGGASGIGTTAIQLAKLMGATVFATCGSDKKAERCRDLGADRAINYRTESFAEVIRAEAGDVDVILDIIGGPYLGDNIGSLARGGRLVFIAFSGGRMGQLDIARVMMNGLTVTGSTLRSRPVAEKARLIAAVREHVWPLLASGAFRPVIDSRFPLERAADAHRRMEASGHVGKIVLTL